MSNDGLATEFLTDEEIALLTPEAQERLFKFRSSLEELRSKNVELLKQVPTTDGIGASGATPDAHVTVVEPSIPGQTPTPSQLMIMIEEMRGELREMRGKIGDPASGPSSFAVAESRFVDAIADAAIARYEQRDLKSYNGLTDPDEFLKYLEDSRITMGATKTRMCQIFPSLLEGDAQTWFHNLPPRSLTSYDDLARKFVVAFNHNKRCKKTQYGLFQCKQGPQERLSCYLQRFSREMMAVERTNDDGPLMALYAGLTHTGYWSIFGNNPPATFAEACEKARPFINSCDVPGTTHLPPAVQAAQQNGVFFLDEENDE